MEPMDSPLVAKHEAWYVERPEYIARFVDRGSRYLHHIVEEVEKRKMPMEIALLPVIESAFNPHAYSRSKASGLWQFIPSTGKNYGLSQDWWKDNRRDVIAATDAALTYLQRLHGMFNSWELALAAYNCGEGCVGRAIAANQRKGLPTDFQSLKLPPETRELRAEADRGEEHRARPRDLRRGPGERSRPGLLHRRARARQDRREARRASWRA